jgi:hypothetical protein
MSNVRTLGAVLSHHSVFPTKTKQNKKQRQQRQSRGARSSSDVSRLFFGWLAMVVLGRSLVF